MHLGLLLTLLGIRCELGCKVGDVAQVGAAVRTRLNGAGDIVVGHGRTESGDGLGGGRDEHLERSDRCMASPFIGETQLVYLNDTVRLIGESNLAAKNLSTSSQHLDRGGGHEFRVLYLHHDYHGCGSGDQCRGIGGLAHDAPSRQPSGRGGLFALHARYVGHLF